MRTFDFLGVSLSQTIDNTQTGNLGITFESPRTYTRSLLFDHLSHHMPLVICLIAEDIRHGPEDAHD